jgi:predicted unusual protein kinase regulating ubiquinone biosynthesis (AarF/ABC1/UbiB family)
MNTTTNTNTNINTNNSICLNYLNGKENCHINKFLKNIWFLIHTILIISSEYILYFFSINNYETYVNNIAHRLAKLNILYVKIFQALALTNQINLLKFADNAPWNDNDIDLNTLHELEAKFLLIVENDYKPINSGMISLVFKGTIVKTNEKVVIKMKRNNIENVLNDSIEKMMFCVYLASFIPIIDNYQISEVIQNSIDLIRHQTNFTQEVVNMQQMKHNCKYLKYVKIPHSYPAVTDVFPNLILMEHIEGNTLDKVLPEDYPIYASQILKFSFVTLFMKGLCHGDLHVGNILFIKELNAAEELNYTYKICILDFGIIYEIKKTRDAFFYILSNICLLPPREIATNAMLSGILEPVSKIEDLKNNEKEHYDNIINIITEFINETVHISGQLSQINIFKLLTELNDYINNNNLIVDNVRIRPSEDIIKFQIVFGMLHGVALKLCNDTYIALTNQVMTELFQIDASES